MRGFVLERRREVVGTGGSHTATRDVIHLDRVTATQLEREAAEVGLRRNRPGERARDATNTSAARW